MNTRAAPRPPTGAAGRVVVTGGSGFVGRAVVAALTARGQAVTVVDRWAHPDPDVHCIAADLATPGVIEQALDQPQVTGVVHLAAVTSVLRSVDDPAGSYAGNVAITQNLLEAARLRGIGRFLLASTNAVVGDVGHATVDESTPLRPLTPYGATKAACEMLLSGYAGAYDMATCALRCTNIYGPGMGHKDSFVPRLMRAALSGDTVRVHGDGRQRRDLVHVDDVVAALLAAWDRCFAGTAIVGAGESVTVLDLVETARAVTGCALLVEHVPAPAGEMPAVIVDTSRAGEQLGYRPVVSLPEGLATVWKDFADGTATRSVPDGTATRSVPDGTATRSVPDGTATGPGPAG